VGFPCVGPIDRQEQDWPFPYPKGGIHRLPKDQPISGRDSQ